MPGARGSGRYPLHLIYSASDVHLSSAPFAFDEQAELGLFRDANNR
jgi:hypothetical protein